MQCPQNPNDRAVLACQKAKNIKHGVDPLHKCNLRECSFWNTSYDRMLFVCKTGLHLHRCSNQTCTLAYDTNASGFFVCPVSGIEMKEQSMVHANVVKITSRFGSERWGKRYNYKPTVKSTAKAKKKSPKKQQIHSSFVNSMLCKIARSSPNQDKLIKRVVKLITQKTSFVTLICKMAETTRLYKPMQPCPTNIIAAICKHANKLQLCLNPRPSNHVLIATIASLLTSGLSAQGVVIYPKVPWFVDNMPPLTLYAQVEHIQCRNMSACTRAIKQVIFQKNGIVASLVFQLTF